MIDLQIFRFKKLDLHPLTWVPKILLIMKKNYYGFDSYLANYENSVNRIILSIFLFTWKMIVSQPAHFESSLITIEATLRRITSFSISLHSNKQFSLTGAETCILCSVAWTTVTTKMERFTNFRAHFHPFLD